MSPREANRADDNARDIVRGEVASAIEELQSSPTEGQCKAHASLAHGVGLALKLQLPIYEKCVKENGNGNGSTNGNTDSFTWEKGKLKVNGTAAVNSVLRAAVAIGVLYLIWSKFDGKETEKQAIRAAVVEAVQGATK